MACKEHNQDEWDCGNIEGFSFHIKKPVGKDLFMVKSDHPWYVQKRCLGCNCANQNNPTDELTSDCPVSNLKDYL
jgi:hypothetical protein